jgi:predicted HD phosphohydrolase
MTPTEGADMHERAANSATPPPRPAFDGPKGRRMADFSDDYQAYLEGFIVADRAKVADRMLALIRSTEHLEHGHEVTQLEHMLQTATRAERAGAAPDIVVAALFHDIGKAVSNSNHPAVGAEMLRPWVSDEAYWIVKVHQDFQGIHYFGRMGLDPMMRDRHRSHPSFELAERFVDDWDQEAFDPSYPTESLEHFEDLVRDVFGRVPRRFAPT